jgi:hypothetical protein
MGVPSFPPFQASGCTLQSFISLHYIKVPLPSFRKHHTSFSTLTSPFHTLFFLSLKPENQHTMNWTAKPSLQDRKTHSRNTYILKKCRPISVSNKLDRWIQAERRLSSLPSMEIEQIEKFKQWLRSKHYSQKHHYNL